MVPPSEAFQSKIPIGEMKGVGTLTPDLANLQSNQDTFRTGMSQDQATDKADLETALMMKDLVTVNIVRIFIVPEKEVSRQVLLTRTKRGERQLHPLKSNTPLVIR